MTKHEEERLIVVETKIDNITDDIAEIKQAVKLVAGICHRVDSIEKTLDKNEKEHANFLSKNGFTTISIIFAVLIAGMTVYQLIKGLL